MEQIYLILTKDCNLSCGFCIRDYNYNLNNELTFNNIDKILNEIKGLFPNTRIILSGGEPTLYKNFDVILEKTCKMFDKVTINTNGTTDFFKTDNVVRLMKTYKFKIQFSIDGDEKLHNMIRGANNFSKTLENIMFCNKFDNIKIVVATTVANNNFLDNFHDFYNNMKNIENIQWDIKRVSYTGEADIKKYDYLDNTNWNNIVDLIEVIDKQNIINIFKTFDFEFLDKIDSSTLKKYEKNIVKNCGSGTKKIYIYPNMDILACTCYEKYPSGNLQNNTLKNILESKEHFQIINQQIDNNVCNSCRYKILCNGGCLGSGFFTYNQHNVADIKCPKVYEDF